MYSYTLAVGVRVTPAHLPSQMARSFSSISTVGCDLDLYSVWAELCSSLLWGASSSLTSTSEAHWLASPNSCIRRCLIIMPLVGVMTFNHIQMSTSNRLSNPSSSCQMVVGIPSRLCCDKDSMAFYWNIFVFLFDIKRLNILCILEVAWGICAYV